MELIKLVLTWRNGRQGNGGVSKCLDSFFLLRHILGGKFFIKSWLGSDAMLAHLPILLKLAKEDKKPPSPLKFNHLWLLEEDFKSLDFSTCKHVDLYCGDSPMKQVVDNLQKVKDIMKELVGIRMLYE
jgi:hypothetical protein